MTVLTRTATPMRNIRISPRSCGIYRKCKRWYGYKYVEEFTPSVILPDEPYIVGKNCHKIIMEYLKGIMGIPKTRAEIENNILFQVDNFFEQTKGKHKKTTEEIMRNFVVFEYTRWKKDKKDYILQLIEETVKTDKWTTRIDAMTRSGHIYDWKTDMDTNLTPDKVFQASIMFWAASEKHRAQNVSMVFLRREKPVTPVKVLPKEQMEEMWLEINACGVFPPCFGHWCFTDCPYQLRCSFEGKGAIQISQMYENGPQHYNILKDGPTFGYI